MRSEASGRRRRRRRREEGTHGTKELQRGRSLRGIEGGRRTMASAADEPGAQLPHNVLGGHDTLRYGLATLKADAVPVQAAQIIEDTKRYQANTKLKLMQGAYGSALPLQMQMEHQILSKFQRPPGLLPSSMLGLESLTGALDDIGFEDSFGDPRESEAFVPADMHHGMEVRLGLAKGPVSRSFF